MREWGLEDEQDGEATEIDVLAENWTTVQVYLRCQPDISVGWGERWNGISATEVRSAATMMRVPRDEWPDVLDGVQHMGRVVAEIRNSEANRKHG